MGVPPNHPFKRIFHYKPSSYCPHGHGNPQLPNFHSNSQFLGSAQVTLVSLADSAEVRWLLDGLDILEIMGIEWLGLAMNMDLPDLP